MTLREMVLGIYVGVSLPVHFSTAFDLIECTQWKSFFTHQCSGFSQSSRRALLDGVSGSSLWFLRYPPTKAARVAQLAARKAV